MKSFESSRSPLLLRIENTLPQLTKSEQQVALYMLEKPEEIIYFSVAALAERCGVSDPTVVRTCQKLGFPGYQNLKLALAQTAPAQPESVQAELSPQDDIAHVSDRVFQSAVLSLNFTRDTLDPGDLESAAQVLLHAGKIVILAVGASGPLAMDLQHKLLGLSLPAAAFSDPHLQAMACADLGEKDAVFAISLSGRSRAVVDGAGLARDGGAKIVALTGSGRSPLSRIASVRLTVVSGESKGSQAPLSSRVAAMTVLDVLCTYIALRAGEAGSPRMEKGLERLKY